MADVARLALSIDSSSVTAADRALLNFNRTAKETAAAAAQMKTAGAQWGLTASGLVAPTSAINAQLTGMSKGMKDAASATQTASQSAKTGQKDFTDLFRSLLNAREGVEGVIGGFLRLGTGAYLVTRAIQTTTGVVMAMVKPFIENAAAVESMRASYTALLNSPTQGASMVAYIQDLSTQVPIATKAMSDGTKTLLGFGFTANEVRDIMPRLSKVAQGNSEAFNHLAVVYGQVRAQGKMYMNDIRQFTNAGVPMIEALAAVVGKPQSEIGRMIKEGKIGLDETKAALEALTDEGGRFANTLSMAADTLNGQLTLAANNFSLAFADIGKKPTALLKDYLAGINGILARSRIEGQLKDQILGTGSYEDVQQTSAAAAVLIEQYNKGNALDRMEGAYLQRLVAEAQRAHPAISGDMPTRLAGEQALGLWDPMSDVGRRNKLSQEYENYAAALASHVGEIGWDDNAAFRTDINRQFEEYSESLLSVPGSYTDDKTKYGVKGRTYQEMVAARDALLAQYPKEETGGGAGRSHRWYQGGLPETLPYGGANDIRRTNAGYGYYGYVEPPLNPEMPVPYIDPNSRYRSMGTSAYKGAYIHDTLGGKAAAALGFDESTEDAAAKTAEFAKQIDNMVNALESAGKQSFVDSFKAMGKAWSEGGDGAEAFADSLANIGVELLNQLPMMLLEAGLRAAISGKWGLAAILIGASGLIAFTAGALDTEDSNDTGTATAAELADLYKYYIEAETFNQESRKRSALSGFANGTSFAPGGWSRVGERGPELMYVPRGASIIPHERTIGYADGVGSPPSSVSVIVNNTVTGTSARQETSEDGRTVTITVEKIVKSLAARGGLNGALATGANVKRKYTT